MRQTDKEINSILTVVQSRPTKGQRRAQNIQKVSNWLLGFCIAGLIGCCLFAFTIAFVCTMIDIFFGTNIGPNWNK